MAYRLITQEDQVTLKHFTQTIIGTANIVNKK